MSTQKYARSLDTLPEEFEELGLSSLRRDDDETDDMWLTTPLGDRHFPIVMIDGIHLGDHLVLIALGIDTKGKKQVLGLREGDT